MITELKKNVNNKKQNSMKKNFRKCQLKKAHTELNAAAEKLQCS